MWVPFIRPIWLLCLYFVDTERGYGVSPDLTVGQLLLTVLSWLSEPAV